MPQNYPGGVAPTPETGPRSVPVPWDPSHYTSEPSVPDMPEIPQSPWQTNFSYDPNWTGTLRFRMIGPRLLAVEGSANPTFPPVPHTPVALGTMPAGNVPSRIIRVPLSAESADKKGDYVIDGVVAFYPDGSVTAVYGDISAPAVAGDFSICGIIPLD